MTKLVRPFIRRIHGFLDQYLGMGIHRTGGFIQYQDGRVSQDGTCDGQQLHLALGNVGGLFVEHEIVSVRQGADEMVRMGGLGCRDDFLIGGIRATVADVLHDGAVEKPGILQDHAEHAAQVIAVELLDVVAVHQDGTAVDIVETHQQLDHGGLAGTGWTDDGDLLARFGVEGKVIDDDLVRTVTEVNILEIYTTFHY